MENKITVKNITKAFAIHNANATSNTECITSVTALVNPKHSPIEGIIPLNEWDIAYDEEEKEPIMYAVYYDTAMGILYTAYHVAFKDAYISTMTFITKCYYDIALDDTGKDVFNTDIIIVDND